MQNKDEISTLLEGVKSMDQTLSGKQEESKLADAFGLTAGVADKLIKQITLEQEERNKNKKINEADKPADDDLMGLDLDDLPSDEDDDDEDGETDLPDEEGGEENGDDYDDEDVEKEEARIIKNLKVLATDAKKMESAVRAGKVNIDEAKEVLRKMLEYVEPLIEEMHVGEEPLPATALDKGNAEVQDIQGHKDSPQVKTKANEAAADATSTNAVTNNKLGGRDGETVKTEPMAGGANVDYGQTKLAASELNKGTPKQTDSNVGSEVTKGGAPASQGGAGAGEWKNVTDASLKQGTPGHMEDKENKDAFLTLEQVKAICPSCAEKMESLNMKQIKASIIAEALQDAFKKNLTEAEAWSHLPAGWDEGSMKKFLKSLTGDSKHKITKCIEKMSDVKSIDNPGAYCASLVRALENEG